MLHIYTLKIAPKLLMYINPKLLLNYHIFLPGKTISDQMQQYFWNCCMFPNIQYFHINQWSWFEVSPLCFLKSHHFRKYWIFPFICLSLYTGKLSPYRLHRISISLWILYSPKAIYFIHEKYFSLARKRYPSDPHLFHVTQPIRSLENLELPVCIGHWTSWPENPGYHTWMWNKLTNSLISDMYIKA